MAEVKTWACGDLAIQAQINRAAGDRFAALWLAEHSAEISDYALAVLEEARRLYKVVYANLQSLDLSALKIADWDIGWYQIKKALGDIDEADDSKFKPVFKELSAKLLPQIYALGFLRDEVKYFGEEST